MEKSTLANDGSRRGGRTNAVTVLFLDHSAQLSGGEIALVRMLHALDRLRVTPLVLLAENGPLVERMGAAGVETHVLPLAASLRNVRKGSLGIGGIGRHVGKIGHFARYALAAAAWARRRGGIDIVHTNSLKSDLYGALVARLLGRPLVWHVRDHIDASYLPGPAALLFRRLARALPARVIAVSESVRQRLLPSAKIRVVYDGLTEPEMAALAPPLAPRPNNPVVPRIGIVGRLDAWKGQHVFLDAAAQMNQGDAVRFVIAGGPLFGKEAYEQELRARAQRLGIAAHVDFLGHVSDVAVVLHDLDVLVHASVIPEPFGLVVIEGMAAGLPVVAADAGGVREIIDNGASGLLVPPGDSNALAGALSDLLADPSRARRIAQTGQAHVRERFTAAGAARGVESVYEEIRTATPGA